MERKLTDVLTVMIDAGLITPLDSLKIRYEERTEQFSYHPSREDIDLLQKKVFSEVLLFHRYTNQVGLPVHNAIAFL